MALKAVIDSLDGLEEHVAEIYKQDGDKFIMDIADIDSHPKVRGLVTANRENIRKRDEHKARADELEARLSAVPEDYDAEEYARLKAEADPEKKGKADTALQSQRQLFEQRMEALTKKKDAELAAIRKAMEAEAAHVDKLLVDDGLTKELVGAGVDKDLLDGAVALLRRSVKVIREEGSEPRAVVATDMGEQSPRDFVVSWIDGVQGQKYRARADGPDANGGRPKSGERNPFDSQGGKVKPNLTELQTLISDNPVRAAELARKAGYPVTW